MKIILATAFTVFVCTWFTYNPKIVWLQLLASGPIAFTTAGFWMLMGSMGADIMDFAKMSLKTYRNVRGRLRRLVAQLDNQTAAALRA